MKGAIAYDDATKDSWRGWKWNAITSMLCGDRATPSRKASILQKKTVLYLAGPKDLDRRKALSHGFANHNVIAIDVVKSRIASIRCQGGFGICSSMQAVLLNWPANWTIDVVDCDLCSGVVSDVLDLALILKICPAITENTVFSGNLMRGRDRASNELRQSIGGGVVKRSDAWTRAISCPISSHMANGTFNVSEDELIYKPEGVIKTNSYRSKTSGQVFDSIIHFIPKRDTDWCRTWKGVADKHLKQCQELGLSKGLQRQFEDYLASNRKEMDEAVSIARKFGKFLGQKCKDHKASRKIAALRAMRTMYLEKTKWNAE